MEFDNNNPEKGCCWHFAQQEGGREDGPNDAMMQNFKASPYKSLVREAIQNSLDAVLDHTKPVKVEFKFGNLNTRSFKNFYELKHHIKGCQEYFNWQPKAVELYGAMDSYFTSSIMGKGIGYIRISDFNTKGMDYDPNSSSSRFYAFARAAGVSAKLDQESGGSFGFGKSAYFQLSPIGTVFISTLTNSGQSAFEGVSWLCTHKYKGNKVCSVGYYDNNGGMPITDPEKIPNRFNRSEPGTNFYILGFRESDKSLAIEEMILEVLRSFWMAIECGKLEVSIDDREINSSNLAHDLTSYFNEEIDDTAKRGYYNPRPYYNAVRGIGSNPKARKFVENIPILGECVFYLLKEDCTKDKIIYMRRPLMLVYGKRTQTSYGVFGVFVCSNPKGDEILRSIENPAHDEWKATNWRDKNGRIVEDGTLALEEIHNFRQRCFAELFSNSQETALEITGLDDLLYIPENLLAEEDPEADHTEGLPTGFIKDEGLSLTTDIKDSGDDAIKNVADDSNIGSVKITRPGTVEDDPEDEEGRNVGLRIQTDLPVRRRGKKPRAGNSFRKARVVDSEGSFREYIPVEFRVVAQNENGQYYHNLIIHAPHNIVDGDIEIVTIGEQSDDIVNLDYCDNGMIEDNLICGASLKAGRNVIKILFSDNMRHAIKLKAYENK
jgi:hypothetical protein